MGVRMALGAQLGDVLRLVLAESLKPALLGVGLGLGAALALTRLMQGMLVGVSERDPLSFALVPLILLLVCAQAGLAPALRAARIDPTKALCYE